MIPQIAELTVFFMNLVTVARLERNPTVKEEIKGNVFYYLRRYDEAIAEYNKIIAEDADFWR